MIRAGLVQLNVSDDPAANLDMTLALIARAKAAGAQFVLTPECTNGLWSNRATQRDALNPEASDPTLAALRRVAMQHEIWLLAGSLALKTDDAEGRFANRSILISPGGAIVARYDKIHMFDVNVSETEIYRESSAFRPGSRCIIADTPFARIGLTVCYDVRFPHLHRRLAKAGAQILTVPAAFNHITGAAHWEVLLRARAIETGCFVLAPAQTGYHPEKAGKGRRTWGHSLAIAPWGEVLADGGSDPGVTVVDLDLSKVEEARRRVPALTHDRNFDGP
jgi:predicted amidohydrolase